MSDETTSATAVPADLEEAAALLAELRARVEEAAVEIERLTAELVERSQALDELETIMDAVLGVTDTAVVLVGEDRRVRAMTRGAVDLLATGGSQVGRPLSAVLPDELADAVADALDTALSERGDTEAAGGAATIRALPGGEALVVLRNG
jgi:nitrogen fixation/metabolism regulation signal transduction histidine kinase